MQKYRRLGTDQSIATASALATLTILLGCSTPKIATTHIGSALPPATDQLKDGEIYFTLRTTTILISSQDSKDTAIKPVCGGAASQPKVWVDCLNGVSFQPVAASDDRDIFKAAGVKSGFSNTKIYSSSVDGNDLLIKSVNIVFKDNSKQVITDAGAAAVAGFAVAGPVGAIVGAAISVGTGADQTFTYVNPVDGESDWSGYVCKGERPTGAVAPSLSLRLPTVLPLLKERSTEGEDPTNFNSACWHPLPTPSVGNIVESESPSDFSGWFYRWVKAQPPGMSMPRQDFLNAVDNGTYDDKHFPVTPCQSAELQVTWWTELQSAAKQKTAAQDRFNASAASYSLRVANPAWVQNIPLPPGGSISLGSVCGASPNASSFASPSVHDSLDAVIGAVASYKDAQAKAKK